MQVPTRRADKMRVREDGPFAITAAGLARLEQTLARLERELPAMIAEVARTKENGDLSENFEYQDAKHRLRALHGRIASIKDRMKRAEVITRGPSDFGTVQIGSTVIVETKGRQMTFEILGSHEADPSHGRISDRSPLGMALLGRAVGEIVTIHTASADVEYRILEVR